MGRADRVHAWPGTENRTPGKRGYIIGFGHGHDVFSTVCNGMLKHEFVFIVLGKSNSIKIFKGAGGGKELTIFYTKEQG